MLKEKPRHTTAAEPKNTNDGRVVTAKYPGHVWHVDLTVVPTGSGFWTSWLPFALPPCWPFCHWVAVAVDHFSRWVMGCTAFKDQPSSEQVRSFLGHTMARAKNDSTATKTHATKCWKTAPKYLVCDRGPQFDCASFRTWCKCKGIKPPRYGAIGKHGSIAVVERFILTMKCVLACLLFVPYRREAFVRELTAIVEWYNQFRPHSWLGGRTPNEVYFGRFPANRRPRFEPRTDWPRGSACAKPWALVRGSPGAQLILEVSFHHGKKHLPVVRGKRVA